MSQKNSRLVKAMFEKRTTFNDSIFYDISAWTFPLAFNMDYEELRSLGNAGKEVVEFTPPVEILMVRVITPTSLNGTNTIPQRPLTVYLIKLYGRRSPNLLLV